MAEVVYSNDQLSGMEPADRKLPSGLNVLTILTIIGCIVFFLLSAWDFVNAKEKYEKRGEYIEKMNDPKMPSWAKSMGPDPSRFDEMMTKSYENRIPIFMVGIIGYGLCFFGALQMRKRKKQGYLLYVIGQVLPFIGGLFFIGTVLFTGIFATVWMAIVLIFILLYTVQRKHLIY